MSVFFSLFQLSYVNNRDKKERIGHSKEVLSLYYFALGPGRVAQSVGHLTRKSGVLGSIPGLATCFRFSFRFFKRAVVSYWRKYVHEVLVNRLGGLSLPRKSVVRLTDRPDMTVDVYRGRKTTIQQLRSWLNTSRR